MMPVLGRAKGQGVRGLMLGVELLTEEGEAGSQLSPSLALTQLSGL